MVKSDRFTTAAFTIPSLGVDWSGRPSKLLSSTTAEVAPLTEALCVLTTLPPRDAVILANSASAKQGIDLPSLSDLSTYIARTLADQLARRDQRVVLQWIPDHTIDGNVRADRLASNAHRYCRFDVDCAPDTCGTLRELASALRE